MSPAVVTATKQKISAHHGSQLQPNYITVQYVNRYKALQSLYGELLSLPVPF